jgi:hypothetical protein
VPLVALLQEHASMYGLKVKIFSRNEDDFPGGHAFHRRKPFMRDILAGAVKPYIFHMSWTTNKNNKFKFFQQMGEWYLNDRCVQKEARQILQLQPNDKLPTSGEELRLACCDSDIIFKCHYKDKPSIKPCRSSPSIDKAGRSFW